MSALTNLLNHYRQIAQTPREKGTYFEELMVCYLRHEAKYRELYSAVWMYTDWASMHSDFNVNDTGIDLVAQTRGTGEYHAIQCKFYAPDQKIEKNDIDSFFTASGKTIFTQRIIVTTTTHWTDNAKNALTDQNPPVLLIDQHDLEASQIDWNQYQPQRAPALKPKKQVRDHQKDAIGAVQSRIEYCRAWQVNYGLWHGQNVYGIKNCRINRWRGWSRFIFSAEFEFVIANVDRMDAGKFYWIK